MYHLHLVLGKWVTHISVSNNLWENRYHIADTTTVQVKMNQGAVCPRKKKIITFYKLCMHVHSHTHTHTQSYTQLCLSNNSMGVSCADQEDAENEQR